MKNKITLAAVLAVLCLGVVNADDVFKFNKAEDFQSNDKLSIEGNKLILKAPTTLYSAKDLKLNTSDRYRLSGQFRLASGSSGKIRLGYLPLDKDGKPITPARVNIVKGTETEVVAAAAPGQNVIKVKNASKWRATNKYFYVALNVKSDFSDLPNEAILAIAKGGIAQKGDVWEITLRDKLDAAIPAGTKVREHSRGVACIWNTGVANLRSTWINRRGTLNGIATYGNPVNKMWPGTKFLRLMVYFIGSDDAVLEFRNIKIEKLK